MINAFKLVVKEKDTASKHWCWRGIKNAYQICDDIKLGGIANTLKHRNNIQKYIDKFKDWVENKRLKFNRDNCIVPYHGGGGQ